MSPLLKKKNGITDDKYLLRKYCMMSAVFSFGIMMVMFLFHQNTLLFGDKTVLRMDLYHQYGPLYAEVYDRITGGNSIVYSWTSGLGGAFLGNFFNYCSSPFAFIMLIFGHKNMPEAIAVMILLKAMLASVAFTYYVNRSNNTARVESVFFGLFYAFSAYFVAYSWNIMWLDAFAVFPFVILGIERIINYNKPCFYIVAMTYTMITNYYMAYMVCIISVMYFLYFYFGRYEFSSKIFKAKADIDNSEAVIENSYLEETEAAMMGESLSSALVEEVSAITEESAEEVAIETASVDETANASDAENTEFVEKIPEETTEKSDIKKKRNHRFVDNRFWVTGWTFALSSFLCFAIAAFALLPVYYCLQSSSATSGTFPTESKQYFDIFTFIANHLPGVASTIRSSGDNVIPNVYCGLITVMLLPIYFLSSRIPGKQKVVTAILLIACLCGFALNYFNFIWHGFHMPNDLPYRWSFAYSFFLLIIAFKAFHVIDEFSNKAYIGLGFAVMCFVVLVEKFKIPNCDELTIILSVVFAILYVAIFGMLRSPKYKKNAIISLLLFTVTLEIVASDAPKIVMQQSKTAYTSDYGAYQAISERVEAGESELFYRTELSKLRARMDASWYGYNGVSTFSSMAYDHAAKIMKKMGLFGNNINSYTYYPQTPVFNSMFNLKYIYDNRNYLNEGEFYTYISSEKPFAAYEYNYYLPLIFSVDDDVIDWNYKLSNPFTVQNNLMSDTTGISDIFVTIDATDFESDNLKSVTLSSVNSSNYFTAKKNTASSESKAKIIIEPDESGNYYVFIGSKSSTVSIRVRDIDNSTPADILKEPLGGNILTPTFMPNTSESATDLSESDTEAVSDSTSSVDDSVSTDAITGESSLSDTEESSSEAVSENDITDTEEETTNSEKVYSLGSFNQPMIFDVGFVEEGKEIVIEYTIPAEKEKDTLYFRCAKLDNEKFVQAYEKILDNGTLKLESFDETSFSGKINVTNKDAVLWTSIPYDEGWEITVDGKVLTYSEYEEVTDDNGKKSEVVKTVGDIHKIGGGLIGLDIEPGEHTVSFNYKAKGLNTGLKITGVGIAILALIVVYKLWLHKIFEKIGYIPVFFRKPDYYND